VTQCTRTTSGAAYYNFAHSCTGQKEFLETCSHSSSPTACVVWHFTVSFASDQCWRFVSPSFCTVLFVWNLLGAETSLRVILLLRLTNRLHRDVFWCGSPFSLWHSWPSDIAGTSKATPPPPQFVEWENIQQPKNWDRHWRQSDPFLFCFCWCIPCCLLLVFVSWGRSIAECCCPPRVLLVRWSPQQNKIWVGECKWRFHSCSFPHFTCFALHLITCCVLRGIPSGRRVFFWSSVLTTSAASACSVCGEIWCNYPNGRVFWQFFIHCRIPRAAVWSRML